MKLFIKRNNPKLHYGILGLFLLIVLREYQLCRFKMTINPLKIPNTNAS